MDKILTELNKVLAEQTFDEQVQTVIELRVKLDRMLQECQEQLEKETFTETI